MAFACHSQIGRVRKSAINKGDALLLEEPRIARRVAGLVPDKSDNQLRAMGVTKLVHLQQQEFRDSLFLAKPLLVQSIRDRVKE